MKKIFTYSLLAALFSFGAPAFAQDAEEATPIMTLTFDREAVESNFAFSISLDAGGTLQIDWGDGELKDYQVADYNAAGWVFTEIVGELAGPIVKIFGADASKVNYVDFSWNQKSGQDARIKAITLKGLTGLLEFDAGRNSLTTLDCSDLTSATKIGANDNKLTKLILPNSEVLKTVTMSNNFNTVTGEMNADAGNNQILATDWSVAPNLTSLNLNGNSYTALGWFDDFDISKNTKLTTLNLNGCDLSTLSLEGMSALKTFNAQWNRFSYIDLSPLPAKSTAVMLGHNNLTEIKLPDTTTDKMMRLNIVNNAFTFETLPLPGMTSNAANYVYTNQENIINPLSGKNIVDLSKQAKVGETASVFTWTAILDGETEPKELSADGEIPYFKETEPGIFQFYVPVKDLTGAITNELFPNFTLSTTSATSAGLLPTMLTMEVASEEGADGLTIGLIDSEGQNVYIDWGDGEFEGPYTIEKNGYDFDTTKPGVVVDGWDEIAPKVKGNKIQIKGEPSTIVTLTVNGTYAWTTGAATSARVTTIDLSKLEGLQKLHLNNNNLTEIDLSKNTELVNLSLQSNKFTSLTLDFPEMTNLDISNAISSGKKVYGENAFSELDLSKLPLLKNFYSNANGFKPDLSKLPALESAYLQVNGYTDYAPVSSTATSLALHYNDYATFDASGLTAPSINIFLLNNKLGATSDCLKLSEGVNNLNIANNLFTFATLPGVPAVKGTLTYSPQAALEVTASEEGVVDLSSQAKAGETATVFAWAVGDGKDAVAIEEADYTAADGVFTFKKDFEGAICTMTNEAFPKLTLKTVALDIKAAGSAVNEIEAADNAEAEYFNLQGIKVSGNEPGLYIRRQGNKTTKVLVK